MHHAVARLPCLPTLNRSLAVISPEEGVKVVQALCIGVEGRARDVPNLTEAMGSQSLLLSLPEQDLRGLRYTDD